METVTDVTFLGSKITADGECSHEIKRRLLLGRKAMTNIDSILKSRDTTLPTRSVYEVDIIINPILQMRKLRSSHLFSLVIQSCPILCDPMVCSMLGSPFHHQLRELAQTHVHQVGDATQPSHPPSPPSLPALNLSQPQGLFQRQFYTLGGQSIGASASASVLQ